MGGSEPDHLGAHMSIAGGLPNALHRGRAAGCSVVQIFLKNQVQWAGRVLAADEATEFKRVQDATGITTVFAHATYLINLCSPVEAEWLRAVGAFTDELERAERLGLPFVVIHPGSHKGAGARAGLARLVRAVDELHARTAGYRVKVVLENAAGCGNLLGGRAEELGAVLRRVREPERLGFCLDTCHLFAAGYDIATPRGYDETWRAFERIVGSRMLKAIHLNDAKMGLGSHLDRHAPVGKGYLGRETFRRIVGDERVAGIPLILETPGGLDGWRRELRLLRRLVRSRS